MKKILISPLKRLVKRALTLNMKNSRALPVLMIGLISCGNGHSDPHHKDDTYIFDSISRSAVTAKVTSRELTDSIKLNGKIIPDEAKQVNVFSLVSGKVRSVNVEIGDYVQKGQVLAILQSSEVAGVANDLSMAESNMEIAKKNMESSKELFNSNLATEREYTSSRLEYNKSLSELDRAKAVAAITGGTKNEYVLKAPLTGFVIGKNITNNSEVRPDNSAELFVIADLSTVWIMASVYESDIYHIHLDDAVNVSTLADPDNSYPGKIDKIYNVLDPQTRTMKVRISLNNENNALKPEMFATVKVKGKSKGPALSIPSRAIVMDNNKNYVVVRQENKLHVTEINLIKRVDDRAYISGLLEGVEVVISSQLFIYQSLISN